MIHAAWLAILLAPALHAQTLVPVSLPAATDSFVIHADQPGDTLYQVEIGAGRLVLEDDFDKQESWPADHWSTFAHVELDLSGAADGTLEFRRCALGPAEAADAGFWSLPLATVDSLDLRLTDCWLSGDASGVVLQSPCGRLVGDDSWFTVADTALVCAGGQGQLLDCCFSWSTMGASLQAGTLDFADCTFHSLSTGVAGVGGELSAERCLFQSDKTMLRFAGAATAELDSCHFYEAGKVCIEGVGDPSALDLSVQRSWFDRKSAPPRKRLLNLPDSLAQDTLLVPLIEAEVPITVEIDADDSNVMTEGVLALAVHMPLRAVSGRPFRPRKLTIYSVEAAEVTPNALVLGPARLEEAQSSEVALDQLSELQRLPLSGQLSFTVEATPVDGSQLIAGTVSGEFIEEDEPQP